MNPSTIAGEYGRMVASLDVCGRRWATYSTISPESSWRMGSCPYYECIFGFEGF
ncbi:MAG TPA: hypothetical protein PLI05_10595 [Methanotrichaceae archaeon]|nr:hypothetical protein [Methanotrichaceae archaeon]HQI92094.1 hypothetical protein [Methanotrichaceae archaeon]